MDMGTGAASFAAPEALLPGDFAGRMRALATHLDTANTVAIVMAVTAVVTIALTRKYAPRISGSVLVLIVGTALAYALGLPVETVGTRFGDIPPGLPHFQVPALRLDLVPGLLSSVLTITMLGAIESLMSAVVADRMSGDRHNPNVELIAQGVANFASPLFGGLPATGAIARTATNIRTGAKTPISGIIHAATLLAIVLFAAPLASFIPMPILAGILMMTAYGMGEWKQIPELVRLTPAEISVWLITFSLTVFADLTVAVEAGMILAVLLFIRNVTATTTVAKVTRDYVNSRLRRDLPHPRALPLRGHRQDRGDHRPYRRAAAHRDREAPQHDRHRRDRAAGVPGPRGGDARLRSHTLVLRRARASSPGS